MKMWSDLHIYSQYLFDDESKIIFSSEWQYFSIFPRKWMRIKYRISILLTLFYFFEDKYMYE